MSKCQISKKKAKKRARSSNSNDVWCETKINKIHPSCSENHSTGNGGESPEIYFEPSVFTEVEDTKIDNNLSHNSVIDEFIDDDFIVNQNCTINSPRIRNRSLIKHKNEDKRTGDDWGELEKTYSGSLQNQHCEYYSYCSYPNGSFLVLERGTVYFYGLMTIKVLCGCVEVLGYTLNKDSPPARLYSPRGHALLYLKNTSTPSEKDVLLATLVPELKAHEPDKRVNCRSCVIKCFKLEEKNITFIEKHISQQIFPKLDNPEMPSVIVDPLGEWNVIKTNPDWDTVLNDVKISTKLMICGGKGVGKSTFLRYAINKLLMTYPKVRVIDLDPGQSEFTTPGCISLVTATEPIFGCNFTHLKRPDRSILSNISIAYDPKKYIFAIELLIKGLENLEQMPTLVNYMGYTDNIGINIISSAIFLVKPTDILQITSPNPKKNFKTFLQPEVVKLNASLFYPEAASMDIDYNLVCIESRTHLNTGWSIEPRQGREMCILSYFGQYINDKSYSIFDLPMFELNLSLFKLFNFNGETVPPAAVNSNLVALCAIEDDEKKLFQCLGWAIVRGVDMENDKLVILTVEDQSIIDIAECLVLNGLLLPPSIYMTPDRTFGQIPYVISGELVNFGQITKRTTYSPKNINFKLD